MMIEQRNIIIDKDEEEFIKLQEKIKLKKQWLREKGSEYIISTCIKVDLNFVDKHNLSLYHISFSKLTEEDNKTNHILAEFLSKFRLFTVL